MSKETRPERLSLKETRDKQFDKFRRNLRILRAGLDISGVDLAKKLPAKNGKRILDLEYGRGNPDLYELMAISKYFKTSIEDLLNKEAKIIFQ